MIGDEIILSHLSHTLLNVYFFIYKNITFIIKKKVLNVSSGKQPKLPWVDNSLHLVIVLLNRKNENKL